MASCHREGTRSALWEMGGGEREWGEMGGEYKVSRREVLGE